MTNDNDIKSLLIIDEQNYSKNLIQQLTNKLIKFAKISKNGEIIILDNTLAQDDKLKLSLVTRFIAHSFDNNIPETITLKELANIISERLESAGSRLSKIIKNERFAKKTEKGVYMAQYFVIDKFLTNLENREENSYGEKGRIIRKSTKRKDKTVTGIGRDILDLLINEGFFKTPKTIKQAYEKLKEETKFYDPRIIDMTIRKTFVDSKKILRRIPNHEKGKAKWLYVVR